MNRISKPLFLLAEPYRRTGRDVNSLFCSLFCCMKNPPLCGSARPESGWEVRERSLMAACVGRRFSAPQIVWNRSTRRTGARGGARVGRPRCLRILTITGGSSMPVLSVSKGRR